MMRFADVIAGHTFIYYGKEYTKLLDVAQYENARELDTGEILHFGNNEMVDVEGELR